MLFVPPSMPAVEAQEERSAEEVFEAIEVGSGANVNGFKATDTEAQEVNIPRWIKTNAGWWADEQITDRDFLKGIKYLMENLVLQIPTNQLSNEHGILKSSNFNYELPDRQDITTASIFGKFSEEIVVTTLFVKVITPDGKITKENIRITKNDIKFTYAYLIKPDFPIGEYQITVGAGSDIQLGPISFVVREKTDEEKPIPFWIKNTAGWWASDTISNAEFVNALQFLVKEQIIKVEQKVVNVPKGMDPDLLVYRTQLNEVPDKIVSGNLIQTKPFTAVMVYSTQNEYCSTEEKRKTSDYAKMSEHLLNKLHRSNQPTEIIGVCMELHEIVGDTYPFTLKEVGVPSAQMVIYIGGIEPNLESYDDKGALGWWSVDCTVSTVTYECQHNQIVVCDECRALGTFNTDLPPVNAKDSEIAIERGMFILAHEIGHSNHYERNGDGLYFDGYWSNAFATSIHDNQRGFDLCHQQDLLENELCKKLYEKKKVNDRIYIVMDINYAMNNWKGEQKEVLKAIEDLVGSGANVDGFNKSTYMETHEKDDAELVVVKEIFSLEYPDNRSDDNYRYDWFRESVGDTTDPEDQTSIPCCDVWEADMATQKLHMRYFQQELCRYCSQDTLLSLSGVDVWFLENVHSAGESDEVILDQIANTEWEWCDSLTMNVDARECQNFNIKFKKVYLTDEGRKAHTVVFEFTDYYIDPYLPKAMQIQHDQVVYTATEIHDGNDAWYISTETVKDIFDKNPEQYYRFIESFTVIDYNTPP